MSWNVLLTTCVCETTSIFLVLLLLASLFLLLLGLLNLLQQGHGRPPCSATAPSAIRMHCCLDLVQERRQPWTRDGLLFFLSPFRLEQFLWLC